MQYGIDNKVLEALVRLILLALESEQQSRITGEQIGQEIGLEYDPMLYLRIRAAISNLHSILHLTHSYYKNRELQKMIEDIKNLDFSTAAAQSAQKQLIRELTKELARIKREIECLDGSLPVIIALDG